ncbi:alpha/beta hydrolase family protein [Streptacidiphilus jiangxiensis]|uniref:Platelet-activating factor acetylhydrolase, isoform II n=1 Tax=Streptacidiphilus jiangxiensis TaxID=235985 RepID=A0A1H7X277_STRJI|nr:acetylhydrolase [Streptacidiphilus jiangxiensis]SEM27962.1 Platelet-activating factor acetylhydrolase, isoform II [Streptacidiphilus jiangxiensis]
MTTLRSAATALALALVLPLPIVAAGTASAAPVPVAARAAVQLALPRPTGPYAVGVDVLHLVDRHRQDPWVPSAGPRQLMVSLYYPARRGTGRPAPYMNATEAKLLLDQRAPGSGLPPHLLADTRTYAFTDARPDHGRYPLVVLSPGFGLPRQTLTALAVDLTSHGYVVALVDHTYEDSGTTFPDGRTLTCTLLCSDSPDAPGPVAIADSRAEDVSFVLDQLAGAHPVWRYAHLIDSRRIGMAGHSLGGAATVPVMATDRRVRAGADLDGAIFDGLPVAGLGRRPLLLLGNSTDHTVGGGETSWSTDWPLLDGWKRWLTVTGSTHLDFTDLPVLAAEVGYPIQGEQIAAARSLAITRSYVRAFFDLQLKGVPQPLFDGPSRAYPEVVFQQPVRPGTGISSGS